MSKRKPRKRLQAGIVDFPDEEEHRRGEQQMGGLVDVGAFGGPLQAQGQGLGRRDQQKGRKGRKPRRAQSEGASWIIPFPVGGFVS